MTFPRPCVEFRGDIVQDPGPVEGEVGALREILPQQPICVLVAASLPGRVWVAEVDRHPGRHRDLLMLGHFPSLVPGHRPAQLFRECVHRFDDLTS